MLFLFQYDGHSDEVKREQMEQLVRQELERWDSESSLGQGSGGRASSFGSTAGGHHRSNSSNNNQV